MICLIATCEQSNLQKRIVSVQLVSLAERSKAPDSSSGGAIRVGSNPTADTCILLFCNLFLPLHSFSVMPFAIQQSKVRFSKSLLVTVARLAQSVERQPFKLVVVGSSPTVGNISRLENLKKGGL